MGMGASLGMGTSMGIGTSMGMGTTMAMGPSMGMRTSMGMNSPMGMAGGISPMNLAGLPYGMGASSGMQTGCRIRMQGIPYNATEHDIAEWFSSVADPLAVDIDYSEGGKPSGNATVLFASLQEAQKAMTKDKEHMQHRYIELFLEGGTIGPGYSGASTHGVTGGLGAGMGSHLGAGMGSPLGAGMASPSGAGMASPSNLGMSGVAGAGLGRGFGMGFGRGFGRGGPMGMGLGGMPSLGSF